MFLFKKKKEKVVEESKVEDIKVEEPEVIEGQISFDDFVEDFIESGPEIDLDDDIQTTFNEDDLENLGGILDEDLEDTEDDEEAL